MNIVFTDGAPRTVTYNVSALAAGLLTVDLTGAGTAASTLSMPNAGTLSANGIVIGGYSGITLALTAGRGAFTQSAGTTTVNSGWDFTLGYGANSTGTYTLSGNGALVANQSEYVGILGTGTFNQSAGTNTIATATGFFDIGEAAGSTGTYNLSGTGTLTVNTNEYVGDIGTGVFNQTGGTHTLNSGTNMYLGYNAAGAGGTYYLSGDGNLTGNGANEYVGYKVQGDFNQSGGNNYFFGATLHLGAIAGSNGTYTLSAGSAGGASEIIGESGTGTFTQTGGSNGANSGIFIGSAAGSTGTYNLSGPSVFGSGYDLRIGLGGTGTFNQSGGSTSVNEVLALGDNFGSTGTYNLSAGSLLANEITSYSTIIGGGGTGIFNQSGGTSTFNGVSGVFVGNDLGSSGTFTISGGTATVNGNFSLGASTLGAGGTGVLNVSDTSVLNVTGTLLAFNAAGNLINLSGGTINAGALRFYRVPSRLNWTGGKLNLTSDVTWDSAADGTLTDSAFGPALALGTNQTLMITGNETLGGSRAFALTLNTGGTHYVTGTLSISPTGTITQNAGSTLYAGAIIQAGGTVNGTLQNQTTFTYQSGSFNGRLLNQGAVSLGSSFTAGNGIENDASMTVNLTQAITMNGAGAR